MSKKELCLSVSAYEIEFKISSWRALTRSEIHKIFANSNVDIIKILKMEDPAYRMEQSEQLVTVLVDQENIVGITQIGSAFTMVRSERVCPFVPSLKYEEGGTFVVNCAGQSLLKICTTLKEILAELGVESADKDIFKVKDLMNSAENQIAIKILNVTFNPEDGTADLIAAKLRRREILVLSVSLADSL